MNKKLYRSYKDKMLGGVAGGLAEYFSIDPTLVRIIFVVSLFVGGAGILAYIILWIVVPEEPYVFATPGPPPENKQNEESSGTPVNEMHQQSQQQYYQAVAVQKQKRSFVLAIILIIIGVLFLLSNFIPRIHFGDFWSLILIAIGIGLLLNARK
ncbi:MAG TPA: PspC domain-containing protein [Ignavibacteriaceae bacterium]|nr:PspC domain-containing protein [Ignavibacteriaceae bacterium]